MLLYCLPNKDLEVWVLDRAGTEAALPAGPAVYGLVSYEGAGGCYVGASRRLQQRLSFHISLARNDVWSQRTPAARLLAPLVARRRRLLVLLLEAGADLTPARLKTVELSWMLSAARAARGESEPTRDGPALWLGGDGTVASAYALARSRPWPTVWLAALRPYFLEQRAELAPPRLAAAGGGGPGGSGP